MKIDDVFKYSHTLSSLISLRDIKFIAEFKRGDAINIRLEITCFSDSGEVGYHIHAYRNDPTGDVETNVPFQAIKAVFPEVSDVEFSLVEPEQKSIYKVADHVFIVEYVSGEFRYVIINEENWQEIAVFRAWIDEANRDVLILQMKHVGTQVRLNDTQKTELDALKRETKWDKTSYEFHIGSGRLFDEGGELKDESVLKEVIGSLSIVDKFDTETKQFILKEPI